MHRNSYKKYNNKGKFKFNLVFVIFVSNQTYKQEYLYLNKMT